MAEEKINEETIDNETETTVADETTETAEPTSKKDKKLKDENKQLKDDIKQLNAKVAEMTPALEKAQAEAAETQDKYLRICAEYDNFRKRSQKEREGIFTDAYSDALKEILPIFDNLERAAQYTEPEQITEGLQLIFKSAKDTLSKLGVEEFGAAGEKFDPNIHNAVMHIEDEAFGEEEIIDVFQKGYKKGDKIIRHAMVKVAN